MAEKIKGYSSKETGVHHKVTDYKLRNLVKITGTYLRNLRKFNCLSVDTLFYRFASVFHNEIFFGSLLGKFCENYSLSMNNSSLISVVQAAYNTLHERSSTKLHIF
mmetsp:Transcript_33150/g.43657  ORF Transcript_33150/g.43657 Transcript_33150/m.43657 type:complete len:106 (-) Transcript_33150:235-552(-)